MKKASAGVLLYRRRSGAIELLLAHPGGPFWANRDEHAWTIPKGEIASGEQPFDAAVRELFEETGVQLRGEPVGLGSVRQAGGKIVHAWAVEQDFEPCDLRSNTFEMEWPPRSGRLQRFVEIDRVAWFGLADAEKKLIAGQWPLVGRLLSLKDGDS